MLAPPARGLDLHAGARAGGLRLWSLTYTLVTTNGISLRRLVIPDPLQSRVNAYARMIAWGGTPFGAVLGGLLTQLTSIRVALLMMADWVGDQSPHRLLFSLAERTRVEDLLQQAAEIV